MPYHHPILTGMFQFRVGEYLSMNYTDLRIELTKVIIDSLPRSYLLLNSINKITVVVAYTVAVAVKHLL